MMGPLVNLGIWISLYPRAVVHLHNWCIVLLGYCMLIADSLGYSVDSLSVIPTVITLLSETESKPNCQKDESVSLWKTGVSLTRCQKPAALFWNDFFGIEEAWTDCDLPDPPICCCKKESAALNPYNEHTPKRSSPNPYLQAGYIKRQESVTRRRWSASAVGRQVLPCEDHRDAGEQTRSSEEQVLHSLRPCSGFLSSFMFKGESTYGQLDDGDRHPSLQTRQSGGAPFRPISLIACGAR